ncbi:hypothetical protein [Streptomyces sp. NPDC002044]|uniref:hypothetical protein n=1 Tax=Streptomyces sp. NPDC002044 TaxID=3154662 RepID=UPI00332C2F8D
MRPGAVRDAIRNGTHDRRGAAQARANSPNSRTSTRRALDRAAHARLWDLAERLTGVGPAASVAAGS